MNIQCPTCHGTGTLHLELNVTITQNTTTPTPQPKPTTKKRSQHTQVTEDIIEFLEVNPGTWWSANNISDRIGASEASVRKTLSRLAASQRIRKRPDPNHNTKTSPTPRQQYSNT